MTNEQIIADIAVSVFGEAAVSEMLDLDGDIGLHTAMGWKARGPYRIKKGEHGIETRLWKKRKRKDPPEDSENAEASPNAEFYLAKAYLFRKDQVEIMVE